MFSPCLTYRCANPVRHLAYTAIRYSDSRWRGDSTLSSTHGTFTGTDGDVCGCIYGRCSSIVAEYRRISSSSAISPRNDQHYGFRYWTIPNMAPAYLAAGTIAGGGGGTRHNCYSIHCSVANIFGQSDHDQHTTERNDWCTGFTSSTKVFQYSNEQRYSSYYYNA